LRTHQVCTSAPNFTSRHFSSALLLEVRAERKEQGDLSHEEEGLVKPEPLEDFTVVDRPGKKDVFLTREHNGEKITVIFDCMMNENAPEDEEVYDEEEGEVVEQDEFSGDEGGDNVMDVFSVLVTKPGDAGTLVFECSWEEEQLFISNCAHYTDSNICHDEGPEGLAGRELVYPGPQIEDLTDSFRASLYEYLQERGVDTHLYHYMNEYVHYKEEMEYRGWLSRIENFLEA